MSCDCTTNVGVCNSIITGSEGELIQKTNVSTDVSSDADQVHVFAADDPTSITLTLPPCPRIGDSILFVNCNNGTTTIVGGDNDIVGGSVSLTAGTSNILTFAACCMWVPFTRPLS